jgi:ribonuclease HI
MLVEMSQPWKMFFDGVAQCDGASAEVVCVTPEGDVLPYSFTLVECCSNNIAEYQALILDLEMAMDSKTTRLKVFGDSKLIINQVLLEYEVKKPDLVLYCKYAIRLLAWFDYINITHVPRSGNKQADTIGKLATALTLQVS